MMIRRLLLACLAFTSLAGLAEAQRPGFTRAAPEGGRLAPESLLNRSVTSRAVRRSGRIADLRTLEVVVGPEGGRQTIGAIAQEVFREHDEVTSRLRGSRGIVGNPRSTDEAYELDDRVILVRTTSAIVSNPAEVARVAPGLVSRRGRGPATALASLDAESRAGLTAFRAEALAYPAGHPLQAAAAQGEEALYHAIEAGLGEIEIVDTYVMPKVAVPLSNGRVVVPRRGDGTFDLPRAPGGPGTGRGSAQGTTSSSMGIAAQGAIPNLPQTSAGTVSLTNVETSGTHTTSARLLNGFTHGRVWQWERRWNFPSGHLEVGASATYGIGIRIPILIETTTTPSLIERWGPMAGGGDTAEVQITARTLDGNASHYTAAGLASSQVFSGHEFVLQLGFGYKLQFRALWKNWIDINEERDLVNRNTSFVPPQSPQWQTVLEYWVPANITRTEIALPGIISGRIQAGARLDAMGSIDLTIEGRMDGQPIPVSQGQSGPQSSRTLNFPSATTTRTVRVHVPPATSSGDRRRFGFEIRDIRYNAELSVVPGAKVTLESLVPGFRGHSWSTTVWLDQFRVNVGGASFGTHEGTQATHGHEAARANYFTERRQTLTRPD